MAIPLEYRKYVYAALVAALALLVAGGVYFSFFYLPECGSFECFQNRMRECSKANYINEDPEASLGYEIKGINGEQCEVRVTLLQAKKGELEIEGLIGKDMICSYPQGTAAYPEKDLSKCHGILKEEMQTLIINKLHSYIIENLGKFEEGLKNAI